MRVSQCVSANDRQQQSGNKALAVADSEKVVNGLIRDDQDGLAKTD